MKSFFILILVCLSAPSYAGIGDFVEEVKKFANETTSYVGHFELEDGMTNGSMVVSGSFADAIWDRAVQETGEPRMRENVSQVSDDPYNTQQLRYRGWNCERVHLVAIKDHVALFLANQFANLSGNTFCKRKVFKEQ